MSLDPPRPELGASTLISGTCASLPADTGAREKGSRRMKPDKSTGHRVGGGIQINSDNVRKEVGPLGSHEFLYMVEGKAPRAVPTLIMLSGGKAACV